MIGGIYAKLQNMPVYYPHQAPIRIHPNPLPNLANLIQHNSNGELIFIENFTVDRCCMPFNCYSCVGYTKLTFFPNGDLIFEDYQDDGCCSRGHEKRVENYLKWQNLRIVLEKYLIVDVVTKTDDANFHKTLLLNSKSSYLCFNTFESMIDELDSQKENLAQNIFGISLRDEAVREFYGIGLGYLQEFPLLKWKKIKLWKKEALDRNPQVYENSRFTLKFNLPF